MKKIFLLSLLVFVFAVSCTYSKEQIQEIINLVMTFVSGLVGVLVGAGTSKLKK